MDYSPILFTPSALLDFLIQIDELKDKVVSVTETADGDVQVEIGDSAYIVKTDSAKDVDVEQQAAEQVADLNMDAYSDIVEENSDANFEDVNVEAGILAEIAKTLAIGGLARLNGKAVKSLLS
jgi:hypothetical protein